MLSPATRTRSVSGRSPSLTPTAGPVARPGPCLEHLAERPRSPHPPRLQEDRRRAHPAQQGRVLGGQHHDPDAVGERLEPPVGLVEKAAVADRHPLVHQQDVGFEAGPGREPEPEAHTRRVGAHGHVQVAAEFGERRDLLDARARPGRIHSAQQRTGDDVLAARVVLVESKQHVEQRADAPVAPHAAGGGLVDAGEHPQQRCLAGAVAAHQRDPVAVGEREAHVVQGAHRERPSLAADASARAAMHERPAQRACAGAVHRQVHRHATQAQPGAVHSQYAIRPRQRA